MEGLNIEALIGFAAAPLLIIALVGHLKLFTRAVADWVERLQTSSGGFIASTTSSDDRSPWPLVTDLMAIAWTFGLWQSRLLPEQVTHPTTVVLLGLALGVAAGLAYEQLVARRSDGGGSS